MANNGRDNRLPQPRSISSDHNTHRTGSTGVCIMNKNWKEEQQPSFFNFISTFLSANSFRLNVVPVAPDFIFNCGGVSVAFIFVTSWDINNTSQMYNRVKKLKEQFANFYVVVALQTREQNESYILSYLKSGIDVGRPAILPMLDLEMGFEKIVNIVLARGACKQHDIVARMKAERKEAVQRMDAFLSVVTSIPGIDNHDANSLNQAIGSIEAIAKASKEQILENTDLSADKAETIWRFFRDPQFYCRPKIN